jgi:hypothetical protein
MTNDQRLTAFLTTASKERLQKLRAPTGQDSSANFHPVIELGMVQHLHHRTDCARLGVVRAVYQTLHSRVHQSACAHGARFNCSKELAVSQAVITEVRTGLAKRNDFGVGGWVGVGEVTIPASPNDLAGMDHDRAHRDFARFECASGRAKSLFHPEFVGGRWSLLVISH